MDKQQQEKFPQQDAPEKNTDDAFVKVSNDGSPEFPQEKKEAGSDAASKEPKEEQSGR